MTRSSRHMKLLLENKQPKLETSKLVNQQIQAQDGKCPQCEKLLSKDYGIFSKPRVCYYTNKVYCTDCHKKETSVIPVFIIHDWDFKQYPVCSTAKVYLDEIMTHPVIVVSAINPDLFNKVPNLNKARVCYKLFNIDINNIDDSQTTNDAMGGDGRLPTKFKCSSTLEFNEQHACRCYFFLPLQRTKLPS